MEIFVEIFTELYTKLFKEIFPDRDLTAKQSSRLEILCIIVSLSIISMLFIGIIMLACIENSVAGIILTCIGGVMVFAHFIIFSMLKLAEEKEIVQEESFNSEPEPLIEEYTEQHDDCGISRQHEEQ